MMEMELKVEYPDRETAEAVMNALSPDNQGYVSSEIDGSTIVFRMQAETAGTMRNTADDLLACLKVAEDSVTLSN